MTISMQEDPGFQMTQMQKELVIQRLRERGCRITKQRLMLLDIILGEECSCCKEIYYRAVQRDQKIGTATVYRMVNTLEEIGAISRKNMYKVSCDGITCNEEKCVVEFEDGSVCCLSEQKWNQVMKLGLESGGYMQNQKISNITIKS